jgi:hypothetical protein
MLVLIGVAIVACFIIINGLLIVFSPRLFLRLHDFWARGDYVTKTDKWRTNWYTFEAKLLGLVFVLVGIVFLFMSLRKMAM